MNHILQALEERLSTQLRVRPRQGLGRDKTGVLYERAGLYSTSPT